MSFEELQKLKQTIGAKVYNETVFGRNNVKKQTDFKRANKNRPREMSSKRPIKIVNNLISVKKSVPRDPRFDPICGTYDEKTFKSNYRFINDLKKDEKKELKKELEKTEDPEMRKKIKLLIQRLVRTFFSQLLSDEIYLFAFQDNQIREQEKRDKQQYKLRAEKEEVKEMLRRGEKPVFKKKCK